MNILLIDDSKPDVVILTKAFNETESEWNICSVSDGEAAINYLYRQADWEDAVLPDVIILDLNLPRQSGFIVLETIKGDADLMSIPVVVLSTSDNKDDINRAYRLQVSSYYVKESSLQGVRDFVERFNNWWGAVALPEKGGST